MTAAKQWRLSFRGHIKNLGLYSKNSQICSFKRFLWLQYGEQIAEGQKYTYRKRVGGDSSIQETDNVQ